ETFGDVHRQVTAVAAVGRARRELRRIRRRQIETYAAVVCFDVEAGAVPMIASQIDGDAAVRRAAVKIAADVAERHAAIHGPERRRAAEVADGNPAVS